ncbi:MAG: PilZ domain-containing protein [Lachnospiraceae bacterium]|nr:PilZ domain-containing protein [Lachnospiraceae bacterium]
MLVNEIKVGKSVDIFVKRTDYRFKLVSTIEGVENNRIFVTKIASGPRVFHFQKSDVLILVYKDTMSMWEFRVVHAGGIVWNGDFVHYFDVKDTGKKYNRRNSFRVFLGMDSVGFLCTAKSDEEMQEEADERNISLSEVYPYSEEEMKIKIKDMSENGIGFCADNKLEIGKVVAFRLRLNGMEMYCRGRVVRMIRGEFGDYNYFYGLSMDVLDRRLIPFLYEQQRLQLKKERQMD